MNETTTSFPETPREITQTLKRLSIAAESLGTITGYFLSWPVALDNYTVSEWTTPLELIEVQDEKIVLCKVIEMDFFVNLYFMRLWKPNVGTEYGALTFVLVNNESGDQIKV